MSGTVKRRHAKRRKAFYRGAAQRTDRRSEAKKRFYASQLAKADRDLAQHVRRPCGECHLQPGEICDICGAREQAAYGVIAALPSQPVRQRAER
jgi:hypothetical protein